MCSDIMLTSVSTLSHILSHILSAINSDILSGILSGMCSDVYSFFVLPIVRGRGPVCPARPSGETELEHQSVRYNVGPSGIGSSLMKPTGSMALRMALLKLFQASLQARSGRDLGVRSTRAPPS